MFALIDHPSALKDFSLPFLVAMLTAFILYSFKQTQSSMQSNVLSWIIYFALLAIVFTAYIFIQRWTANRLNKFALILFILGMEYILLKLMTDRNPVFLADLFKYKIDLDTMEYFYRVYWRNTVDSPTELIVLSCFF